MQPEQMEFSVQSLTPEHIRTIASWQYEPPFAVYNLSEAECLSFLEPTNRYYSVLDQEQRLIGYCCFGAEARVLGGSYSQQEPTVLDVGVGMHPGKTGKGLGGRFVETVLEFGHVFSPAKFRVTIAAFNQRSLKVFCKLGFAETHKFKRPQDGLEFMQLERVAKTSSHRNALLKKSF